MFSKMIKNVELKSSMQELDRDLVEMSLLNSIWSFINNMSQNSKKTNPKKVDILKFTEGWHSSLYDELGVHPISNESGSGFIFRVYAPNAKHVNVLIFQGIKTHVFATVKKEHGIWETIIHGVTYGDFYKFEVIDWTNFSKYKTDPFGFYNQQAPFFNSIIYDRKRYKWHDKEFLKARKTRDFRSEPMAIYEVHLGSWKKTLDNQFLNYKDLAHLLIDYVLDMGYTHIEFLPLAEHPFIGSWGYQVTGYFGATSRYGNPDELKYLIDYAHKNGIKVIMDFVPVHYNKDDHGLYKFDGTHSTFSSEIEFDRENYLWGTANFDLGKNEVKSFLLSSLGYWIEEFHIDGFRFDAVSYIIYYQGNSKAGVNPDGVEFIKSTISNIKKLHPDILIIAEDSSAFPDVTSAISDGGLGFDLKWDLGFSNDLFRFMKKEFIERKHSFNAFNDITFSMVYNFNEKFLLAFSHDEVVHLKRSLMNKSPGFYDQKMRQSKLMISYMFAHPGKKLLFMGIDIAQFKEWNERVSLDWHLLENQLHYQHWDFVKDLIHTYKQEPSLYVKDFDKDAFEWVLVNELDNIFVFKRYGKTKNDEMLVVLNFSDNYYENYSFKLNLNSKNPLNIRYSEILNSDNLKYGGSGAINSLSAENGILDPFQDYENSWRLSLKIAPFAAIFLKKIKK
ncbi:1,4-alpha-glucan branching enzyme [Mycoplasmopsis agassizii]|uniref:1,4-alpha-glucan branching enzyme n=2 Tax=Mycoplasmopsis agassizii TaxID=33922 RepID=A0A269TJR6_9BACT|nr:1,4-alpha-glucan branching enzyme [Mycoplasmopsis agassizii]